MQTVIQEFTIGFFDASGVFSVYAKKDDVGRALKFHIYDNSNDYAELLSDPRLVVSMRVVLPNGFNLPDVPVSHDAIDPEELSVTVPLLKEVLQQSGIVKCELMFAIAAEHSLISTTHFQIIVIDSFNRKEPETEVMFDTWSELYIEIQTLKTEIETDEAERVENENIRVSNENIRISNENTRISNEQSRETAEAAREAAEQIRESRVQEQVDEAHMWANGSTDKTDKPSSTNNAKSYSYDSEAWAVGKRGGVDVQPSDVTYENNAKYYAAQARAVSGLFNGTVTEWNALSADEKANYRTVILVDD